MSDEVALYVVATPIGNLNDITLRAIETLKTVAVIAAEDTRHSRRLLSALSISNTLLSLHEHNERQRIASIVAYLARGESVALISDAGTPLISDPGYDLVREVRAAGFAVVPIPGPSALIAALSVAGVAVMPFTFYGFLPRQASARRNLLQTVQYLQHTLVLYESSHRLVATLQDMQEIWGAQRQVVLAKELTKMYEAVRQGAADDLLTWLAQDTLRCKGEFVLLVERRTQDEAVFPLTVDEILKPLAEALPLNQASHLAAQLTGLKKNALYRRAMQWK